MGHPADWFLRASKVRTRHRFDGHRNDKTKSEDGRVDPPTSQKRDVGHPFSWLPKGVKNTCGAPGCVIPLKPDGLNGVPGWGGFEP